MKILVLVSGWHFAAQFYENLPTQKIPEGWKVDYVCVAHRMPDDSHSIEEKESVRNYDGDDYFKQLDQILYHTVLTLENIERFGWKFMIEENTIGDMNIFNQWADKHDYTEYDIILLTHDDNLILSDQLFVDISCDIPLYKPVVESRYGVNGHQFNTTVVDNDMDWYFLDNGYSEYIPKAFSPRGSFSFYKKELIDLLPNNRFIFDNITLTREGKTDSPADMMGVNEWNTGAGNMRDFLLSDLDLVDKTRWFSDTKRVSKYCIEGERGYIHWNNTAESHYWGAVKNILKGFHI